MEVHVTEGNKVDERRMNIEKRSSPMKNNIARNGCESVRIDDHMVSILEMAIKLNDSRLK